MKVMNTPIITIPASNTTMLSKRKDHVSDSFEFPWPIANMGTNNIPKADVHFNLLFIIARIIFQDFKLISSELSRSKGSSEMYFICLEFLVKASIALTMNTNINVSNANNAIQLIFPAASKMYLYIILFFILLNYFFCLRISP